MMSDEDVNDILKEFSSGAGNTGKERLAFMW